MEENEKDPRYMLCNKYHNDTYLTRLAFIRGYTLASLRLKKEKWNKITISDEQRGYLNAFLDKGE